LGKRREWITPTNVGSTVPKETRERIGLPFSGFIRVIGGYCDL